jgi:hypothetical protein
MPSNVSPVDRVAQTKATIFGAIDPAVERAREVRVVDRVLSFEPPPARVATDVGFAGATF